MKKTSSLFLLCLLFFSMLNSINASALSVVVHVPEKYTDVEAGERFYFEVEVRYPENPKRKDLRLNYEITTESGELIAQSKTLKSIETQISFIDFIIIPESVDKGLHFINVKIQDYDTLSEEVSASFQITRKSDQMRLYIFVLLSVVAFIVILIVVTIFIMLKKNKKQEL